MGRVARVRHVRERESIKSNTARGSACLLYHKTRIESQKSSKPSSTPDNFQFAISGRFRAHASRPFAESFSGERTVVDMTEVPLTTTEISEQVKRRAKPVNQGYSLDAYFAVADSTGVTVRQRAPRPPPFSDPTTTAPGDLEPRPPAHHIHPRTSHPNSTQAKIYRDEGNQQELFRVLMAFCTLVVETMGKHRDHAGDKHKARYRAYLAEVKACMEEMEAIKPGINAEAKVYRERMHAEEPKARPPPVAGAGTAAGVASSITRPHGWNSTSDSQPSTSGTMSNGGTIDDLLSASPEELAAAAAASLGTLTLYNRDDTAVRQSQSEDGLHRYRPKSEFAAAATSTSTARHSLLGTSLPPQPKPQTHIPQTRDVTPISTSSQAGNYPSVRSTKTAVPEMRANLSTPPPPPQGPPPQTPSAPPMPMPMPPHASTNTAVTGVTVPRGQPPPPPGPPPSGVPTGNYGLSAASRFVYFSTLVVYAGD